MENEQSLALRKQVDLTDARVAWGLFSEIHGEEHSGASGEARRPAPTLRAVSRTGTTQLALVSDRGNDAVGRNPIGQARGGA